MHLCLGAPCRTWLSGSRQGLAEPFDALLGPCSEAHNHLG
jgi:hypothetical protein